MAASTNQLGLPPMPTAAPPKTSGAASTAPSAVPVVPGAAKTSTPASSLPPQTIVHLHVPVMDPVASGIDPNQMSGGMPAPQHFADGGFVPTPVQLQSALGGPVEAAGGPPTLTGFGMPRMTAAPAPAPTIAPNPAPNLTVNQNPPQGSTLADAAHAVGHFLTRPFTPPAAPPAAPAAPVAPAVSPQASTIAGSIVSQATGVPVKVTDFPPQWTPEPGAPGNLFSPQPIGGGRGMPTSIPQDQDTSQIRFISKDTPRIAAPATPSADISIVGPNGVTLHQGAVGGFNTPRGGGMSPAMMKTIAATRLPAEEELLKSRMSIATSNRDQALAAATTQEARNKINNDYAAALADIHRPLMMALPGVGGGMPSGG